MDISTLHPEPVHIFRLWQVYLDNVDPLLKVTHAPSLQPRIIEAASNLQNVGPVLEALMFSIYCMAMLSLSEDACRTMLGTERDQLLIKYQFGCQQALMNARFLRTDDLECLTAFYLYLVCSPKFKFSTPVLRFHVFRYPKTLERAPYPCPLF